MKLRSLPLLGLAWLTFAAQPAMSQKKSDKSESSALEKLSLSGLKFRSVGPALTSGRIADIAVNPNNHNEYYVASAAGGVWKTTNAGTTYKPIFDGQGSYSIGCVTIDPNNSNVVWVGSGENNNQRSVNYGDGIYKSVNGGSSWKNMGLKNSEHIHKIIVHPDNSDVVYVASNGPLWSAGGDRGVYKTTDGGETWTNILAVDEHTGACDLIMDPRNPMVMYAAFQQRRRHVFTYIGGGPSSGIYKTVDGGATWKKANSGLPSVDLGRIGLAISPVNPEKIYAIVEATHGKGGFFISTNRGASWSKQSGTSTSGNYYQEIICDPVDEDIIYIMDTWLKITKDGGKTIKNVGEDTKHVDNHCIWINPNNNQEWIVGCDGGLYETYDAGKTWVFKANLPVTQFYKVAVDDDKPFYNIYGGTQDNFSLGGPSRTLTDHGIVNSEWFITHGGDGFESQIDPHNPDIVYAQSQYGVLVRYDRKSGEEVGIQPKERKGELGYRWNWDAPLAVSPHKKGRLYFAANKVFRSDDYGNNWTVISEDLTRQINRNELAVMGRTWSTDALMKNASTSPFGTIVAFSESHLNDNLLAIGTDDGVIQITTDGGTTWRKIENIGTGNGAKHETYVNAIYCSQHDENVIYAAFNRHKYGDFKPYIYKSSDKGRTWTSINANLPERGSVYSIEEDHVMKGMLFVGTEFGVYFTNNDGNEWKQLKSGLPPTAVRDIAIQRTHNDLVLGTFGRGFYVLDDYSALRELNMEKDADLMNTREAWMWEKSKPLGLSGKAFQGDGFYSGENLDPVALFTYYIKDDHKSLKSIRKKEEGKIRKDGGNVAYPTYEDLKTEKEEAAPKLIFTIKDNNGKVVRKLFKKPSKGVHRIKWDLRYASKDAINLNKSSFYNAFADVPSGTLVDPGTYTVTLSKMHNGEITQLDEPVSFEVKALNNTVLPAENRSEKVAFQRDVAELSRQIQGANKLIGEMNKKLSHIKEAVKMAEIPMVDLAGDIRAFDLKLKAMRTQLNGDRLKTKLDIDQTPTPAGRLGWIMYEQKYTTSTPTGTHEMSYKIAKEEFGPILKGLKQMAMMDLKKIEEKLEQADAPYTPGRAIQMMGGE